MSSSSTNPPYANATSSSTAAQPQQYVGHSAPATPQNSESRFNSSDWGIMFVGMVLTGIIGYFSSLMAVKSDIAENRKDISVIEEKVININDDMKDAKDDLDSLSKIERATGILEVRFNSLEKTVERHSLQEVSNKGITSQSNGTH